MKDITIIVMGASMGGFNTYRKLLSLLPADLDAAIFLVQHVGKMSEDILAPLLDKCGPLTVVEARDGAKIEPGIIQVARPGHHLLIKEEQISTPVGPGINRNRPSIDVLFKSAAAYHGSRVTAVLMTGYQDDGVDGLNSVKLCGGRTLVQDPEEAEYPELPKNAIQYAQVDHVLSIEAIAAKLTEKAQQSPSKPVTVPDELLKEIRIYEHPMSSIEKLEEMGAPTSLTCPECGGALRHLEKNSPSRYICHTGHSFTEKSLLQGQTEKIEEALWGAVRMMKERVRILNRMVHGSNEKGMKKNFEYDLQKIEELNDQARIISDFILSGVFLNPVREKEN